jgi:hypothetical protein
VSDVLMASLVIAVAAAVLHRRWSAADAPWTAFSRSRPVDMVIHWFGATVGKDTLVLGTLSRRCGCWFLTPSPPGPRQDTRAADRSRSESHASARGAVERGEHVALELGVRHRERLAERGVDRCRRSPSLRAAGGRCSRPFWSSRYLRREVGLRVREARLVAVETGEAAFEVARA